MKRLPPSVKEGMPLARPTSSKGRSETMLQVTSREALRFKGSSLEQEQEDLADRLDLPVLCPEVLEKRRPT